MANLLLTHEEREIIEQAWQICRDAERKTGSRAATDAVRALERFSDDKGVVR